MQALAAFYRRRDVLRGMAGLGALACGLAAASARAQAAGGVFRRGAADIPWAAITYDDCFSIGILQELERLLAASPDTKVTFFPVGQALLNTVRQDEGIWKRLRDAGHEIGYHTHDHRYSTELSLEEMRDDYDKWLAAATAAWGEEPEVRFGRPPYAELSDSFRDICNEKGLVIAWWTHDWSRSTSLGSDPGSALRAGDIGLLHPSSTALQMTAEVLGWLPRLRLRGVSMSQLYEASLDPESFAPGAAALTAMAHTPTASGEAEPNLPPLRQELRSLPATIAPVKPSSADLRALAVYITPMRPRGDSWSCDVQVRVANLGPEPAEDVWAKVWLAPDGLESECVAELAWRLPTLTPGHRATLTARQAVSGPAAVMLPAGRYTALLQVGFEHNAEADGNVANDAVGPLPFELHRPPRA